VKFFCLALPCLALFYGVERYVSGGDGRDASGGRAMVAERLLRVLALSTRRGFLDFDLDMERGN
jgi:hypothetical protein